jgi:hypothetical protein
MISKAVFKCTAHKDFNDIAPSRPVVQIEVLRARDTQACFQQRTCRSNDTQDDY